VQSKQRTTHFAGRANDAVRDENVDDLQNDSDEQHCGDGNKLVRQHLLEGVKEGGLVLAIISGHEPGNPAAFVNHGVRRVVATDVVRSAQQRRTRVTGAHNSRT
jgi:hypothetical protein